MGRMKELLDQRLEENKYKMYEYLQDIAAEEDLAVLRGIQYEIRLFLLEIEALCQPEWDIGRR